MKRQLQLALRNLSRHPFRGAVSSVGPNRQSPGFDRIKSFFSCFLIRFRAPGDDAVTYSGANLLITYPWTVRRLLECALHGNLRAISPRYVGKGLLMDIWRTLTDSA
jgi:hypothetical protein